MSRKEKSLRERLRQPRVTSDPLRIPEEVAKVSRASVQVLAEILEHQCGWFGKEFGESLAC